MRVEESKANFTSSRVIFDCKLPGHEPEQVRPFQAQVPLLMNSMKKLPDPTELFEWYLMQFGHVIRTIGYLWVQDKKELAVHYGEKNQQGWMQEVQRMPVIQMRNKPKHNPAKEKKKAKLAAAKAAAEKKKVEAKPKAEPKKKKKKKK